MDFSIPDEPDTDALWDSAGNEWQRKVDTKKVWKCVETESVRSWVGLLRDFGPLTDTPPVPKVGDILTEKTAFYVGGSCLYSWDALQRCVRYEPIRVVRVGWSS